MMVLPFYGKPTTRSAKLLGHNFVSLDYCCSSAPRLGFLTPQCYEN